MRGGKALFTRREMALRKLLYVMHCPGTDLYKIGISQWPTLRARDIARAVERPVDLLAESESPDARQDERELHNMFAAYRKRFGCGDGCTEWFEMDPPTGCLLLLLLLPRDVLAGLVRDILAAVGTAVAAPFFPLCLTRRQAEQYLERLGVPASHLRAALRAGKIRPIGRGRGWRVKRADLDSYAKALTLSH
jgi:excisionase family DNA binding protein